MMSVYNTGVPFEPFITHLLNEKSLVETDPLTDW